MVLAFRLAFSSCWSSTHVSECIHLLPRKEVIQPHLPLRLPCYDFVPVIGPALGGYFQ